MRLTPEASQVVARIVKVAAGIAEDRKILGLLLDETASFFSCDRGAIFTYSRGRATLLMVRSLRPPKAWDPETLLSFFRNEKPLLPSEIIMAPVRAGNEVIGVLALEKVEGFDPGAGKVATEMLKIVGTGLGERRRRKALEIACGAGGALARGLRPKDVIYRILHGARRLIDYDHSATVYARVDDCAAEVVAEQVAWAAGKGSLVGKTIGLDWKADSSAIWEAVRGVREEGAPDKQSGLLVPLAGARGTIGLLEIASAQPEFFRASDLQAARILAPYLVLCLAGIDCSDRR